MRFNEEKMDFLNKESKIFVQGVRNERETKQIKFTNK